jgi:hypothetical protein
MERLRGTFEFEARGLIDVKGKGPTPAYLLVAPAAASVAPTSARASTR